MLKQLVNQYETYEISRKKQKMENQIQLVEWGYIFKYQLFDIDIKNMKGTLIVYDRENNLITKWKVIDNKLKLVYKEMREKIELNEGNHLYLISYVYSKIE
jgi:hypothetical protein